MYWEDGRVYKGEWREGQQLNENNCLDIFNEYSYSGNDGNLNENIIVTNGKNFVKNEGAHYHEPERPCIIDKNLRFRLSKNSSRQENVQTAKLFNNYMVDSFEKRPKLSKRNSTRTRI
eukprot:GHVR01066856.1.p1 GENE.GHVR01066856.1~~GHVR01066856.1.p1  ORF type:complete len:118 (+),score=7.17 GHVR01066856.1:827-1180(+)